MLQKAFMPPRACQPLGGCGFWVAAGILGYVSVISGGYHKYHRLSGLNNKHLFLAILKAGKSKIKVLANLVSGQSQLPGL